MSRDMQGCAGMYIDSPPRSKLDDSKTVPYGSLQKRILRTP